MYIYMYMCIYIYLSIYIHTFIHTYIQTFMHTHTTGEGARCSAYGQTAEDRREVQGAASSLRIY